MREACYQSGNHNPANEAPTLSRQQTNHKDEAGEFDQDGFDKDGYNQTGYNLQGFNRDGYGSDGYNQDGYDAHGYDRHSYSEEGIDRAGNNADYYSTRFREGAEYLREALEQLHYGKRRYAVYDAKTVAEDLVKLVIVHHAGKEALQDCFNDNLNLCKKNKWLPQEMVDALHDVRKIANMNCHELGAGETFAHKKVYFVIMQTYDLLQLAKEDLQAA